MRKTREEYGAIINNGNEYHYSMEYIGDRIFSVFHSPQCLRITGYTEEEFHADGMLWLKMIYEDDRGRFLDYLRGVGVENPSVPVQHRIVHKDGREKWVINNYTISLGKNGKVLQLNGSMLDITELKAAHENEAYIAHHDPLTKLPNRNLLYSRLEKSVQLARREKKHLAIMFLDLDNFKIINDSMGHDAGDKVLIEIAKQLSGFVRAGDTVSRWGGDEFVVVLWDCGVDGAAHIAEKLTGAGIKMEGMDLVVSMSGGISIFPEDGDDYQILLKNADIAMYHAKKSGRQKYEYFTPRMNARVKERSQLTNEIRKALDSNELVLYYQPRINLGTGKMSGVEALIRWRHPSKGIILPNDFLPIAVECGLLRQITEWVILNACRQIRSWQHYISDLPVAVNIAPAYFLAKNFEEYLRTILWETGISSESLELEVTEDIILIDPLKIIDTLTRVKDLGVKLSIDNFGTGYSNLRFFQKVSVDTFKIDNTFVKNLAQKKADRDLVRAMIGVGHSMNVNMVAEGIEDTEQLGFLKMEGCDEGQGNYFCRPRPAEELTALIAENANWMESGVDIPSGIELIGNYKQYPSHNEQESRQPQT